jgi:DUF35 OB-fold domain, acyl-CoA-associated
MNALRDKYAIVGTGKCRLGQVGASSLRLLEEAVRNALDEAGLTNQNVDGVVVRGPDDIYAYHQVLTALPPSLLCPHCSSAKWSWTAVRGRGRIFSYVVYHRVYHPGFADEVPYAVAVIELDEGPRMISNVIGIAPDQLACDMAVEIAYQPITEAITLPKFKPIAPQ